LVLDADVIIENFRLGVMEKWELAPNRLHEINPALVILRVTGFGQFGPYAKRRAFGTLAGPSVYDQLGIVPGRHGNRSPNNAPRNTYRTRDGRWVAISASATSIAERVMRLVGRPDIAEQPWFHSARERVRHGDQLDDIVARWIRARAFDEVMTGFEEAGAAIAPVYDIEQLMNDPQVAALGAITTVEDEELGPLRMQNRMFRLSESPGAIRFPGRRLGQDNKHVFPRLLWQVRHPSRQLTILHDVFTPSTQELTWAQTVVDAFDAGGGDRRQAAGW
jgi:crotonobetainyl-CoA:carnitine CoA-transferase CaiB-like acyl-CoA transferase